MPYIGKAPVSGGFHKLDSLTASATATYALTLGSAAYFPETANQLLVSLNGVIQAPQDSFTVSGSNLVFDSALTASDSIDFVVALGDVLGVGTPTDGTITTAKIGNNAVTDAKLATSLDLSNKTLPTGSVLKVVSHIEDGLTYYPYVSNTDELLVASNANDSTSHVSVALRHQQQLKILLQASLFYESDNVNNHELLWAFHRDSTRLGAATTGSRRGGIAINQAGYPAQDANSTPDSVNMLFVDSPSSTSAITYAVGFNSSHAANLYINRTVTDNNDIAQERGICCIVAMEIAG